jgi:hypothetical protein
MSTGDDGRRSLAIFESLLGQIRKELQESSDISQKREKLYAMASLLAAPIGEVTQEAVRRFRLSEESDHFSSTYLAEVVGNLSVPISPIIRDLCDHDEHYVPRLLLNTIDHFCDLYLSISAFLNNVPTLLASADEVAVTTTEFVLMRLRALVNQGQLDQQVAKVSQLKNPRR